MFLRIVGMAVLVTFWKVVGKEFIVGERIRGRWVLEGVSNRLDGGGVGVYFFYFLGKREIKS